ncbi:MAG TPA: mannosyl-3-phosphoglycerate synthase [Verrucomicrobiae bacterium]|nr:mannosyl-3-phosphoglycerate synthase [Verrucomicrobiae bacterium]
MRIERPKEIERFGAIRFGELQRIFELDSGLDGGRSPVVNSAIMEVSLQTLAEVEKDMAIVVPVRDERLKLIEGVLCGIPHPCLIIVVSNSPRRPVDRFAMEQDALQEFCTFTNKKAIIVHQKDPIVARALAKVGYRSLLGGRRQVRDGKAEGMLIATILAKLAGKKYIGFVDADNYFPGAVEEYVRVYASVFATSDSPYTMVRVAWHSKPKIVESKLFFRKWGRTTSRTNGYLNRLLADYTGYETEIIKTGNAGEHAMTMDLALALDYSSGYSIEPYHIINLIEKFGGIHESAELQQLKHRIEVYQVESRNPHLHEAGDDSHIDDMDYQAMQAIYHSAICPERVKKELHSTMRANGYCGHSAKPRRPRYFPPLGTIDFPRFAEVFAEHPFADAILGGRS